MAVSNLLFKRKVPVVDNIELTIPTIQEILSIGEQEYFQATSILTAQPFQYMVQLDDIGIDYTTIDDFQLFMLLKQGISEEVVQFLFGDTLPLFKMVPAIENATEQPVLVNPDNLEQVFTALTLEVIADALRKIHFTKKEVHKPKNKRARQYLIDRERRKMNRRKSDGFKSVLEPLVVSLVNAPEFPYNYRTCGELTIYQFFSSVQQIPRRIHYDNLMHGVYVGMIDTKNINWEEVNWLG